MTVTDGVHGRGQRSAVLVLAAQRVRQLLVQTGGELIQLSTSANSSSPFDAVTVAGAVATAAADRRRSVLRRRRLSRTTRWRSISP